MKGCIFNTKCNLNIQARSININHNFVKKKKKKILSLNIDTASRQERVTSLSKKYLRKKNIFL